MTDENTKGIPDFWLTIFKNVEMLAEMIQVSVQELLLLVQNLGIFFIRCAYGLSWEYATGCLALLPLMCENIYNAFLLFTINAVTFYSWQSVENILDKWQYSADTHVFFLTIFVHSTVN